MPFVIGFFFVVVVVFLSAQLFMKIQVLEQYDYLNTLASIDFTAPFSMQIFEEMISDISPYTVLNSCHIDSSTKTYIVSFRAIGSDQVLFFNL